MQIVGDLFGFIQVCFFNMDDSRLVGSKYLGRVVGYNRVVNFQGLITISRQRLNGSKHIEWSDVIGVRFDQLLQKAFCFRLFAGRDIHGGKFQFCFRTGWINRNGLQQISLGILIVCIYRTCDPKYFNAFDTTRVSGKILFAQA